uniref:Uncharacterized protein n=1 Tax=Labrus bergylta TaxID=56723 RepID=A0A3Q3FDM5_9LABR
MNSQDLPAKDAPLTVNEQVIVMSGHETIRVLEVEVDASQPPLLPDGKSESKAEEGAAQLAEQPEVGSRQSSSAVLHPAAVQTLTPAVPVSVSLAQPHATVPITVQGCPQVRQHALTEHTVHIHLKSLEKESSNTRIGLSHFS